MPIKKSDLYSSLWKSCDQLRGTMDPSQYKDYILVLLFIKYVSDKAEIDPDARIEIPEGCSFADITKLKGNSEIGDKMNKIFSAIAAENDLTGVIDYKVADWNSEEKLGKGKDKVDTLSKLIAIFENDALSFKNNRADGDDLLGDAYEYLMKNFATESGKSKGEFYTPAEVSRILAKVIEISNSNSFKQTLYDPTSGSGSLLIKSYNETKQGVTIYGQENNNVTAALAKMNMILHNIKDYEIAIGNTIANPAYINKDNSLKTFDFAVANPPFSNANWSNGINPVEDKYDRFKYGVPPEKNGDYAFLLHLVTSLNSTGKGAIILPHGVLFRGNAEQVIRKNLVQTGIIKAIIGLPANLFYGTGIPACIIVIDKENAQARKGIFFIDGSKGFVKDGNKNRLREMDIRRVTDVYSQFAEIPKYSRLVTFDEIEKNEFNLNIPRYIDSQEQEDIHDIFAHYNGGIPLADIDNLSNYWNEFKLLKNDLFSVNKNKYYELKTTAEQLKSVIENHKDYTQFVEKFNKTLDTWVNNQQPNLLNIDEKVRPKKFIYILSDDILNTFKNLNLINAFDVYQQLLNYWTASMQDDVYFVVAESWKTEISWVKDKKGKPQSWECDLIPKKLLMEIYFTNELKQIEDLQTTADDCYSQIDTILEENSDDNDTFADFRNKSGNIAIGDIEKYMKKHGDSKLFDEDFKTIKQYAELHKKAKEAETKMNSLGKELDALALAKYSTLTTEEIKDIVVNKKWLQTICTDINTDLAKLTQQLTNRIKELYERYNQTLPQLNSEVEDLEKKVEKHLKLIIEN